MGAVLTKAKRRVRFLLGVGGIGSGMFLALRGDQTLGRNESRAARILPRRDFCKLHIVTHYAAALTGRGRAGLTVIPIGKIGDDPTGSALLEHMRQAGMDTRFVAVERGRETLFSVCFTYPDGDGGNMTTDDSASAHVTAGDVQRAVEALDESAGGIAAALPEVPLEARRRLLALSRQRRWQTAAAFNTGEVPEAMETGMLQRVDLLGVNREEAAAIAQVDPAGQPATVARAAGEVLAAKNPGMSLCVTAGEEGSYGFSRGEMEFTPAAPVPAVNTAGAGDATLAGLMVAAAAGLPFIRPDRPRRRRLADAPLETALDLAALLAGLAVTSEDTINFDADADAVRKLAEAIGADATRLRAALEWH